MQKANEDRYGRPQENLGGTLLTRTTGLSPADRALAAEGARTGATLLSYTVPPVALLPVSDSQVFLNIALRRGIREVERQANAREQARRLARVNAKRAAMGLPAFDPMTMQPQNLDEYELMMGRC